MANIRVESDNFVAALNKSKKTMASALSKNILKAAHIIAVSAKNNAPKASSELANSIQVKQTGKLRAEVFPAADYGLWVGLGRKAGSRMPNIQAIKDWIKIKKGFVVVGSIDSAAFLVARSIVKKSIPPNKFMQKAALKNKDKVVKLVGQAPKIAIGKVGL